MCGKIVRNLTCPHNPWRLRAGVVDTYSQSVHLSIVFLRFSGRLFHLSWCLGEADPYWNCFHWYWTSQEMVRGTLPKHEKQFPVQVRLHLPLISKQSLKLVYSRLVVPLVTPGIEVAHFAKLQPFSSMNLAKSISAEHSLCWSSEF